MDTTSHFYPLTLALLLAFAPTSPAQSFNIDIGATAGTNPTPAYGAGAGQPGFWNWVTAASPAAQPLSPLAGGAPIASCTIGPGGGGDFAFDNPATLGDDEKLMDDCHDLGGVGAAVTYSFAGLAPDGYWIYTYAWAPDNAAFRTKVHVPGSADPDQSIGGAWIAAVGQQYTVTFAKHFVIYAGGPPLTVNCTTQTGFGSVNGFQIVSFAGAGCDGRFDSYCTAKVNSAGCTPFIAPGGINPPSAGAFVNGFAIRGVNILPNKPGILLYSKTGYQAMPFQGGWLCVLAPIKRTPGVNSGGAGACGGVLAMDFNAFIATGVDPGLQVAGQSVWCQWWSRDNGFPAPDNSNLTNALEFTICF